MERLRKLAAGSDSEDEGDEEAKAKTEQGGGADGEKADKKGQEEEKYGDNEGNVGGGEKAPTTPTKSRPPLTASSAKKQSPWKRLLTGGFKSSPAKAQAKREAQERKAKEKAAKQAAALQKKEEAARLKAAKLRGKERLKQEKKELAEKLKGMSKAERAAYKQELKVGSIDLIPATNFVYCEIVPAAELDCCWLGLLGCFFFYFLLLSPFVTICCSL